jgi:hypothetical protein
LIPASGGSRPGGGPIHDIRTGDTAWIPPNEKHWHATPKHGTEHIAMQKAESGARVNWLDPVTDAQYLGKAQRHHARVNAGIALRCECCVSSMVGATGLHRIGRFPHVNT